MTSTYEAKCTGQFKALKEMIYLRSLASKIWLTIVPGPTITRADNKEAIGLPENALGRTRSKHFNIKLRKCCKYQEEDQWTSSRYSHTSTLRTFPQGLPGDQFQNLVFRLGLEKQALGRWRDQHSVRLWNKWGILDTWDLEADWSVK